MLPDTSITSHLRSYFEGWPFRNSVDQCVAKMRQDGYSAPHIQNAVRVLGRFVQWLTDHHGNGADVHEGTVACFIAHLKGRGLLHNGHRAALARLLAVLREADLIKPQTAPPSPYDQILTGFKAYLEGIRGLRPKSVASHVWFARPFLLEIWLGEDGGLARLSRADVIAYVERHAPRRSAATGRAMCARIRSLLRYLRVAGLVADDLAACIPSIKGWKLTTLPTFLTPAQLQLALDHCDRSAAVGHRDYAILMLLGKLGLRAGEVAVLRLDDIDWRTGLLRVRGKGGRQADMPLLPDVGAAVAAYLRDGRPASASREVFLRAQVPFVAFPSSTGVSLLAKRALERAGVTELAHRHSHVFRHTVATNMIRSGGTLTEIGQVLRHQDHDTTRVYAKVDLPNLRALSLPWPGDVR